MHAVGNDNETGCEATSGNARRKNGREADLDYLAGEAQAARIAMRASLSELKATLFWKINPRRFTRQHPRVAIGLGVAGGVTAGMTAASLVGRREHGPTAGAAPVDGPPAPPESSRPPDTRPRGWMSAGLGKVFEMAAITLRPALWGVLQLAIRSGIAAWSTPPTGPANASTGPADASTGPADASTGPADASTGPAETVGPAQVDLECRSRAPGACSADASPGRHEK